MGGAFGTADGTFVNGAADPDKLSDSGAATWIGAEGAAGAEGVAGAEAIRGGFEKS